ncbi:MAG: hypothetical protein QOG79_5054 [Mycobacterium sp.]|jgi:hypothetical protein|nr:hypothetical protein [Mycobacterium sp.]MDT5301812.1 hypothetical protein [Mycobacterium sp.]
MMSVGVVAAGATRLHTGLELGKQVRHPWFVQHREIGIANLVRPQQRVDYRHVALGEVLDPQRRKLHLVAHGALHDGDALGESTWRAEAT